MAIPFVYNVLSVRARWTSTIVAVLGIAGTVGIFVWMLAMARGFQAMLVSSGSPANAMVRRAGSTSTIAVAVQAPNSNGTHHACDQTSGLGYHNTPKVACR